MKDAEIEKQEDKQGQWQQESLAKEYLDQVKCCTDTDCTPRIMKHCVFALKSGEWEEKRSIFKVEVGVTEWVFERIREAFGKVAKDEAGRMRIVQGIMLKSTDFLRRIIAPPGGQGGVTMSYLCPKCNSFLLEDYVWWVSAWKKHCSWWCAICGEKIIGERPTGCWCSKQAIVSVRPRFSKRMRYHKVYVKT